MAVFRSLILALLTCAAFCSAAAAKSPAEILKESPAGDWRTPDPQNILVMDLDGHQIVIELAPRFAPAHTGNIRILAHEGFFDGTAIVRVQDNFVTQWGDPKADTPDKAKSLGSASRKLPAEFTIAYHDLPIAKLRDPDGWAEVSGFVDGFPVAADPKKDLAWITHCYGVVGAGRDMAVDSSTGAELYAIIGQSPRMLDRNITVIGRVLKGMEFLAALPRGTAAMGMYDKPEQLIPLKSVKLAADLPPAERPSLEVLRTESKTWQAFVESRRNPTDAFHVYKANFTNVCNVAAPVRDSRQQSLP